MSKTFITDLHIEKVRHIENFDIPLSKSEMKHLIITGKNGSGKTSVLNEIRSSFNYLLAGEYIQIDKFNDQLKSLNLLRHTHTGQQKISTDKNIANIQDWLTKRPRNILLSFSEENHKVENGAKSMDYVIVYFEARRSPNLKAPKGAEKIELNRYPSLTPIAGQEFIQFMVNRYFEQLMAAQDNETEKVAQIKQWFNKIQQSFRELLDAPDAEIKFDKTNFNFDIIHSGREKYNFNQLSDGYSSVINLVSELIMRMESQNKSAYDVEGVALIDEIETHLHVDLQKKILPFLTAFFPNIQFIVTTHSPFVINSIPNAVICDLEKRIVTEDLSGYSYGAIVESYFGNDNYSDQLKSDLAEYESLMKAEQLTLDEEERLQDLEEKLNQLPKYWAPELDFKLKQIQLEKADRATA
jgi:predicted ATP-binding protein involved in virulence